MIPVILRPSWMIPSSSISSMTMDPEVKAFFCFPIATFPRLRRVEYEAEKLLHLLRGKRCVCRIDDGEGDKDGPEHGWSLRSGGLELGAGCPAKL